MLSKLTVSTLSVLLFTSTIAHASIVPSGTTETSVTAGSNGHIVVDIAPVIDTDKTGDISYNAYTDFNVLKPGVSLNNQAVDARTIINEVVSNNPSFIEGQLEVLGPKAHVIIANPNGITVNGGKFVNTGGLVLSTGRVTLNDIQITPITTQQNTVIETTEGKITIEGEGLSGIFTHLELIAKELFIDGAVTNEHPLSGANTHMVAGSSQVELDSSVSTVDLSNRWATVQALTEDVSDTCPNAICVNISSAGAITGSNIEIALTESGAGVNSNGIITASQNNIEMSANGDITITNQVTAASHIVASTTGSVTLDAETASVTAENGGILVEASKTITNKGGVIAGNTRIEEGEIASNFVNNSVGAVTLLSEEKIINISTDKNARAAIFGENDNVYIQADEGIENTTASITTGGQAILISANGDVQNQLLKTADEQEGIVEHYYKKGDKIFFRSQRISGQKVHYGEALIEGDAPVISANSNVVIEAQHVRNQGGDIFSQGGDIEITAENVTNELEYTGWAYRETRCAWLCTQKSASTIESYGGNIQAANDIVMNVSSDVLNHGGIVQSVSGNISITGETETVSAISKQAIELINIDRGVFHDNYNRFLRYDQGGSFVANMGRLEISAAQPLLIDGGDIIANEESIASGKNTVREKEEKPNPIPANNIGILGGVLP